MPDPNCSCQTDRTWELQQIVLPSRNGYKGGDMKKEKLNSKKLETNVLQGRGPAHRTMSLKGQPAPKKTRGKESSKHFGVRFRPDLHKWVAEIRVAEWKTVDKKVWLGTFDTEVGAARAVDAARKLLKCNKKRLPNFPCLNLDAYAETLPAHLNLNDLDNDAMFKEVTLFVKHKVQEYAASFGPSMLSDCVSVATTAHPTGFYSQPTTSSLDTQQHEFSFHSQQPSFGSSCEDHSNLLLYQENNFPCQDLPTISSSLSSSNSKEEEEEELELELDWVHFSEPSCSFDTLNPFPNCVDLIDDHQTAMIDCEMMNSKSPLSWEELNLWDDELLLLDNALVDGSEYLIPRDDQAYNCAQEFTSMDMSFNETPHNNCSTKPDYMPEFQRTASNPVDISLLQQLHPFNNMSFLMNPRDYLQVH